MKSIPYKLTQIEHDMINTVISALRINPKTFDEHAANIIAQLLKQNDPYIIEKLIELNLKPDVANNCESPIRNHVFMIIAHILDNNKPVTKLYTYLDNYKYHQINVAKAFNNVAPEHMHIAKMVYNIHQKYINMKDAKQIKKQLPPELTALKVAHFAPIFLHVACQSIIDTYAIGEKHPGLYHFLLQIMTCTKHYTIEYR